MSAGGETLSQAFDLSPTTIFGIPDSQPKKERERDFRDPLRREIAKLQVPVEVGYEIRTVYDNPRNERINGMRRGYEFSIVITLHEYTPNANERRRGKQAKTKIFREPFLSVPYPISIDHQEALPTASEETQTYVIGRVAELRSTFGYLTDEQGNSQITASSMRPSIKI